MSKSNRQQIVVFTDGSCSRNGASNAVGGIGIHFPNGELKDLSRIFHSGICTNQRTELYAILTAIRYIKKYLGIDHYNICIKTDSQYSIDCVTKWAYGWVKNGWITKEDKPVANKEFIELLHKYYEKYNIEFEHVEAHTNGRDKNSIGNREADKLATRATSKALKDKQKKYNKSSGSKSSAYNSRNSRSSQTSQTNYKNYRNQNQKESKRTTKTTKKKQTSFPKSTDFIIELIKTTKN